VNPDWFKSQSEREQRRIEGLGELPEGISESWFRDQSSQVQANVLESNFFWGKQNEKFVLGIYLTNEGFITWPNSRELQTENHNSVGTYLFGYPIVPGLFGDVELRSSF